MRHKNASLASNTMSTRATMRKRLIRTHSPSWKDPQRMPCLSGKSDAPPIWRAVVAHPSSGFSCPLLLPTNALFSARRHSVNSLSTACRDSFSHAPAVLLESQPAFGNPHLITPLSIVSAVDPHGPPLLQLCHLPTCQPSQSTREFQSSRRAALLWTRRRLLPLSCLQLTPQWQSL